MGVIRVTPADASEYGMVLLRAIAKHGPSLSGDLPLWGRGPSGRTMALRRLAGLGLLTVDGGARERRHTLTDAGRALCEGDGT